MEEDSLRLAKELLPKQWVVREYRPDYGIDIAVELFEAVDNNDRVYETSGEFFFAQMKSVEKVEKKLVIKRPRYNVEKPSVEISNKADSIKIEVIKFSLDVPLINTVLLMGAANPVLLFLADLSTGDLYFLCINDYAEKILLPSGKKLAGKHVTVEIPCTNRLSKDNPKCIDILRLFAKRAKYYAAFNKFNYQKNELEHDRTPETVRHFAIFSFVMISGRVKVVGKCWPK